MNIKNNQLQEIIAGITDLSNYPIPDFEIKTKITCIFHTAKNFGEKYNKALTALCYEFCKIGENGKPMIHMYANGTQDYEYNNSDDAKKFAKKKEELDEAELEWIFTFTEEDFKNIDDAVKPKNATIPASILINLHAITIKKSKEINE